MYELYKNDHLRSAASTTCHRRRDLAMVIIIIDRSDGTNYRVREVYEYIFKRLGVRTRLAAYNNIAIT